LWASALPEQHGARLDQETIVAVHRLRIQAEDLDRWRVAKKIKPSQRGALKLARVHGNELLCVRYRENLDGTERLTTIELVVERVVIQKRDDPVVSFKIKQEEVELRRLVQTKGATYNGKTFMWQLARSEVLRLGLRSRIAVTVNQIYQEQVRP
jgi:hypothetical protein